MRKPRGRPKNRDRIKEPFEDLNNLGKSTRHGRIPHCSRCKQAGHIKTSCKNEPVVVEGPTNRRGRPSKLPSEIQLVRPQSQEEKDKLQLLEQAHNHLRWNQEQQAPNQLKLVKQVPKLQLLLVLLNHQLQ